MWLQNFTIRLLPGHDGGKYMNKKSLDGVGVNCYPVQKSSVSAGVNFRHLHPLLRENYHILPGMGGYYKSYGKLTKTVCSIK